MEDHEPFLREAIALSKSALDHGGEPFGSVLVKDGKVILRAENSVFSGHDMTNHAEMNLVKLAAQQYDPTFLADCTLYTSTEPCAMCSGAGLLVGHRARRLRLFRSPAWRDCRHRAGRTMPDRAAQWRAQGHRHRTNRPAGGGRRGPPVILAGTLEQTLGLPLHP